MIMEHLVVDVATGKTTTVLVTREEVAEREAMAEAEQAQLVEAKRARESALAAIDKATTIADLKTALKSFVSGVRPA